MPTSTWAWHPEARITTTRFIDKLSHLAYNSEVRKDHARFLPVLSLSPSQQDVNRARTGGYRKKCPRPGEILPERRSAICPNDPPQSLLRRPKMLSRLLRDSWPRSVRGTG